MGKRGKRSFFSRFTFSTAVTIVAVLLILSYLSVVINPARAWFMTIFGLLYIPLLVIALLFFFWALFRGSKMSGVLLLVLAPSVFIAGRFVQLRSRGPHDGTVKIVSYNVGLFVHNTGGPADRKELADSVMDYLRTLGADVICLQEFYLPDTYNLKAYFERRFPNYYVDYHVLPRQNGFAGNVTLSRFPMGHDSKIEFAHSTNLAIYSDLNMNGTKVRVYNCHFESYNVSFTHLAKSAGSGGNDVVEETGLKMKKSITTRPKQVDEVMRTIEEGPPQAIIAGDFNDNPLSYTYHRLRRGRKDAFMEAGSGFGATYREIWPLLRIDYVLYPEIFSAKGYEVPKAPYSDHYPVVAFLKRKDEANGRNSI